MPTQLSLAVVVRLAVFAAAWPEPGAAPNYFTPWEFPVQYAANYSLPFENPTARFHEPWPTASSGWVPPTSSAVPAYPQQSSAEMLPSHLYADRIRELEARLLALERQRTSPEPSSSKDVSEERFTLRPWAVVHADYINFAGQNGASSSVYGDCNDYFAFRRLYLGLAGTGYGVWEYQVAFNIAPTVVIRDRHGHRLVETDVVQIRDIWLAHKEVPFLGTLQLGNFKGPFSLEELTSNRYITFMERAAPTETFSLKRRVGLMACNRSPSEAFGWATGVFFADISQETKRRVDDRQGIHWALRSWCSPLYVAEGRGVLHLGAGYVFTSDDDGLIGFTTRPEASAAPLAIETGPIPAQRLHRGNLEGAVVFGPFSIQSELFAVTTDGGKSSQDYQFYGAYVATSYFLTGESRTYERSRGVFGRVIPFTNFWWVRTLEGHSFGWGAWELAARWSWIDLSEPELPSPLAGQMHNFTLGVNWYWNPQVRMMFEWIHSFTKVPISSDVAQTDILGMSWRADF